MRALLLGLVLLMLLAAAGFVAYTVFYGGDDSSTDDGSDQATGQQIEEGEGSPAAGDGSDSDSDSDADDSTDASTTDDSTEDVSDDPFADPLDPNPNEGSKAVDPESGELPQTDLISDTVDRILIGLGLLAMGVVLVRTNTIGRLLLPLTEYFNFNFYGVSDNDPRAARKLARQVREINKNIEQREKSSPE